VALNGLIVILFELPLTKVSQHWPFKLLVGLAFGLVGLGVVSYGLPLGPAVIILGTLIWTLGEVVGAPAVFAFPAMAGPSHLKGRYIGSFQFMFGLGTAVGPMVGGALFTSLGHQVWLVMAFASVIATVLGVAAVRTPAKVAPTEVPDVPLAADLPDVPLAADRPGALVDDVKS
jgi:MFS family permease